MQEDDVSLGTLLERSLSQADELLESSPIDQPKLHTLLANLELCDRMTSHLGVISTNEELQDISTRSLNCFHVPFYRGMLSLQIKSTGTVIRQQHLSLALEHFNAYVERIKHHRILEPLPDILSASSQSIDQATRRNNKIRMYRKEKELKQSLAVCCCLFAPDVCNFSFKTHYHSKRKLDHSQHKERIAITTRPSEKPLCSN